MPQLDENVTKDQLLVSIQTEIDIQKSSMYFFSFLLTVTTACIGNICMMPATYNTVKHLQTLKTTIKQANTDKAARSAFGNYGSDIGKQWACDLTPDILRAAM